MVTKGVVTPPFRPNTASDNDPETFSKSAPLIIQRRELSSTGNVFKKKRKNFHFNKRERERERILVTRSDATRYRSPPPSFYQIGAINRNSKQPPACFGLPMFIARAKEAHWGNAREERRAEEERKIKEMIRVRDR